MNTTPVWVLGFSVKDVLVSYIDDGLYFEAEDTFVCHCVISTTAALFPDPKFCSRMSTTLTTSTTTSNYLYLMTRAIIMALGVRVKWQLGKKNNACGLGIAYNSKAAGIRFLSGRITTIDEATALAYGYDKVGV